MNDKKFMSTDKVLNIKDHRFKNSIVKKSGSVDSTESPSIMNEVLKEGGNINRIRIKSSKDIKSFAQSKLKPQIIKSKGTTTKRQRRGNKIYWDYIGNKDNIKKYMKKKRKKIFKNDLKQKF